MIPLEPRDRLANDEIEITPEMEEIGMRLLIESGRPDRDYEGFGDRLLVREIFAAMSKARNDTR